MFFNLKTFEPTGEFAFDSTVKQLMGPPYELPCKVSGLS